MGDQRNDIHWTLKGPLWLLAMLFWGAAIYMGFRGRVIAAFIVLVMGLGFLLWSYQYKDWCDAPALAWGDNAWGGGWSVCVQKAWYQW